MFGSLEECNYFVVPSSYSPWVRTSSCNSTQAVPLKQINALNQTFLSYKANDSISLACQRTLLNPISIPQYTFFVSISICVHLPVQKFLEILDSLTFRFTPLVHFAPLCSTHSRSSSLPISSSRWFSSMRCELAPPPPTHSTQPPPGYNGGCQRRRRRQRGSTPLDPTLYFIPIRSYGPPGSTSISFSIPPPLLYLPVRFSLLLAPRFTCHFLYLLYPLVAHLSIHREPALAIPAGSTRSTPSAPGCRSCACRETSGRTSFSG